MITLIQTCIACLVLVWFLPKLRKANAVTTNTWLFLILFLVAMALQVGFIYDGVNYLLGINHVAWLFSYILGLISYYCLYKALSTVAEAARPELDQRLYYWLLLVILFLAFLFPSIANLPAGEETPNSLGSLLFILIPYAYAAYILFAISAILYRFQALRRNWSTRLRWLLLAVSTFLAGSYFAVRIPFFTVVFVYPGFVQAQLAGYLEAIFVVWLIMRTSWVLFFLPEIVYQKLSQPIAFLDKFLTLKQLEALQAELNKLSPPTRKQLIDYYSGTTKMRNLDLFLYQTLIAILDAKQALAAFLIENPRAVTQQRLRLVHSRLSAVQDDGDVETLIHAYQQVAGQLQNQLG